MLKRKELYPAQTPSIKEAGRIANEWLPEYFELMVSKAIKEKDHFVYEGHLPEEENWITPKRFRSAGYKIHFIFLGLAHPDFSTLRVMERAKFGGHNVPPYEIERNFYGNLKQLNNNFTFIDELQIVDTSEGAKPIVLAMFESGEVVSALPVSKLPEWFESGLPALYQKILDKEGPLQSVD
jgi:predicted ABC-type ATPase